MHTSGPTGHVHGYAFAFRGVAATAEAMRAAYDLGNATREAVPALLDEVERLQAVEAAKDEAIEVARKELLRLQADLSAAAPGIGRAHRLVLSIWYYGKEPGCERGAEWERTINLPFPPAPGLQLLLDPDDSYPPPGPCIYTVEAPIFDVTTGAWQDSFAPGESDQASAWKTHSRTLEVFAATAARLGFVQVGDTPPPSGPRLRLVPPAHRSET